MENDSEVQPRLAARGRGTGMLNKSRFDRLEVSYAAQEEQQFETELFHDTARSIIAYNDSPDVGFSASFNPYRGCEHGCIYCYARPTHEYLGLSAGLDFETKLFVKTQAAELLRAELLKKSWKPQVLGLSGVTDCYQPVERKLEITRNCLRVLADFRNPVVIITKNHLVTRDMDILAELAQFQASHVVLSITTLDSELARHMEPRASTPSMRLRAVETLTQAGIPVTVSMAPVIPGLTDHEIPSLLKSAADAGAIGANFVMLRLPFGVKELFADWLERHYPLKKNKVLSRVMEVRGGKLYDSEFGSRMSGQGVYADHIADLFANARKRYGLDRGTTALSTCHFRRYSDTQLSLF